MRSAAFSPPPAPAGRPCPPARNGFRFLRLHGRWAGSDRCGGAPSVPAHGAIIISGSTACLVCLVQVDEVGGGGLRQVVDFGGAFQNEATASTAQAIAALDPKGPNKVEHCVHVDMDAELRKITLACMPEDLRPDGAVVDKAAAECKKLKDVSGNLLLKTANMGWSNFQAVLFQPSAPPSQSARNSKIPKVTAAAESGQHRLEQFPGSALPAKDSPLWECQKCEDV